ncbi:uncharacterized protein HD556DRAFT_518851 [Suillus plorans]|uniref:Uncharacterized protein n=1 Tax=Suillus plorans TaxID=116603 RepID=A0A9P7ANU7_9AGAM|nr:uncharacterized protein HD556DRAFT_518851 [Suillus plorans]KAG1793093.1 hypothetical protein HD556DRAFT_518851 [Suillus plorans]
MKWTDNPHRVSLQPPLRSIIKITTNLSILPIISILVVGAFFGDVSSRFSHSRCFSSLEGFIETQLAHRPSLCLNRWLCEFYLGRCEGPSSNMSSHPFLLCIIYIHTAIALRLIWPTVALTLHPFMPPRTAYGTVHTVVITRNSKVLSAYLYPS